MTGGAADADADAFVPRCLQQGNASPLSKLLMREFPRPAAQPRGAEVGGFRS